MWGRATRVGSLLVLCQIAAALPALAASVSAQGTAELSLPHAAAPDEAVWLELRLGRLPPKAEIEVSTAAGVPLGTAEAQAAPAGEQPAYTIPLPPSAVSEGRVALRLVVEVPGAAARPPQPGEIAEMRLIYVPVDKER